MNLIEITPLASSADAQELNRSRQLGAAGRGLRLAAWAVRGLGCVRASLASCDRPRPPPGHASPQAVGAPQLLPVPEFSNSKRYAQ